MTRTKRVLLATFAFLFLSTVLSGVSAVAAPQAAVDGYVRDPNGVAVANVPVQLFPCPDASCSAIATTTSGSDGYYAIGANEAPGNYLVMTVSGGSISEMFDGEPAIVEVTSGATAHHDFTMVPGGSVHGTVTAAGTPVTGAAVDIYDANTHNRITGNNTDANGTYALSQLLPGLALTITVTPPTGSAFGISSQSTTLNPGENRLVDFALPPADGNHDGVADSDQTNVTSVASAGSNSAYVTIASPSGTTLTDVTASPAADYPAPSGAQLAVGVLGFDVEVPTPGASVDVALYLPAGTNPNAYLKYQNGAWVDFTANTTFAGDVVTLHLTDGGLGDADGTVDGVIVDPGGPGYVPAFQSPLSGLPASNKAQAGSTVTVSFRTAPGATQVPFVAKSQTVLCNATDAVAGTEAVTLTGRSKVRYDASTGIYTFDWATSKAWKNSCRQLVVALQGGPTLNANFSFR